MLKSEINLNKKKFFFDTILLTNLTLAFFPISFILGNFIVNLNLVLFCILGILQLKSNILKIKFDFPLKIIFLFFILIFLSTILSFIRSIYFGGYEHVHLERVVKSLIFFRFFLMLLIIYLLSKSEILNLKYFFISAALSGLIVSLDVIYQYFFGFNIIGLKSHDYHVSSFFGDEHIAGGFIENFSLFSIFFLTFFLREKNILRFLSTTFVICIAGVAIVFSGNKMPLILFLLGLLLSLLFSNKLRTIVPVSLVCFVLLFKLIISSDDILKDRYVSMYNSVKNVFVAFNTKPGTQKNKDSQENSSASVEKKDKSSENYTKIKFLNDRSYQSRLLLAALDTWKSNKIFGNGIKSFRIDCYMLQSRDLLDESSIYKEYNLAEEYAETRKNRLCSNHPHNYYFEILTEVGILGLLVILAIGLLFVFFVLKNFKSFNKNSMENYILLAAIISLILEAFPLRSSGSVFSTSNATYIVLIASLILSYRKKLIKNN